MIRYFFVFLYSILVSQSCYAFTGVTVSEYDYDAIEYFAINHNNEFKVQNQQYDTILNFHNCCSAFLNSDLQEKARDASFFAFIDNFSVAKGVIQPGRKLGDRIPGQRGAIGASPPRLKQIHSRETLTSNKWGQSRYN